MKPVIGLPPVLPGVKVTVAWALPAVAAAAVGAPGTVADDGVTEFDAPDGELTPRALVAITVNVYAVPLVRPDTTIGEDEPLTEIPPGLEVAV